MASARASQFAHVARALTERTASILQARAYLVDDDGMVLAASEPNAIGLALRDTQDGCTTSEPLRVPLRHDVWGGDLVISGMSAGEAPSPRLARLLGELLVQQSLAATARLDQHAAKNGFIHTLLRHPGGAEDDQIRSGQILGIDLTLPRAVMLIDAADYLLVREEGIEPELHQTQLQRRARFVISSVVSFFHLPDDTICAYIGEGELAILKASTSRDLVAWTDGNDMAGQLEPSWANLSALKRAASGLLRRLRHDTGCSISIGIGRYHPGIRGLSRSYQDAQAALLLGRQLQGANKVHCLDGLGSAAFVGVSDHSTKVNLATHLLSPLEQEPELLATLKAFFAEDCCPSTTASRLNIHRNTLSYRLDKVTALSGLDPRHFDDACQIHLALMLCAFQTTAN